LELILVCLLGNKILCKKLVKSTKPTLRRISNNWDNIWDNYLLYST